MAHRLCNLNELLLGDAEPGHLLRHIYIMYTELLKKLLSFSIKFAPIKYSSFDRLSVKEDILRNRKVAEKVELLIDYRYAKLLGYLRRAHFGLLTVYEYSTGILFVGARQNFHQSRFASAVFTHQPMYLSSAERKANIGECLYTREFLAYALECN